jgi:alkanesulfonate monooxygenase SsuD/methylene tetrahydromethanopterin reductase-like flavin-dependent oxidoreductase (luciferase family)
MEFGMFHEFQRRPGQTEADAFTESFSQVDEAEAAGLDTMWLAELHNSPERSVLAAPLSIASAIATRTKRMKIGIAVQVLPLCHPLRIAEEAATVDHISHGRLIFGIGRSGFPRTYQAYGISYAESRERFAEVLDPGDILVSRPVLPFRRYLRRPKTLSGAIPGITRRGEQPRHVPAKR